MKLCSIMYQLLYSMYQSRVINSRWITYVKSLLEDVGLSVFGIINVFCILMTFISDQFIQKWQSNLEQASRDEFYSMFKTSFCLEKYLLRLRIDKRVYTFVFAKYAVQI